MAIRKYTKKRRRRSLRKLRGGTPPRFSHEFWNKVEQGPRHQVVGPASARTASHRRQLNANYQHMDDEEKTEQLKVDLLHRRTGRERKGRLKPPQVFESQGEAPAEPFVISPRIDAETETPLGRRAARIAARHAFDAAKHEERLHQVPTSRHWIEIGHLKPALHTNRSGDHKKPEHTKLPWRLHNNLLPENELCQSQPRSCWGQPPPRSETSLSSPRSETSLSSPRSSRGRSWSRSSRGRSSPRSGRTRRKR